LKIFLFQFQFNSFLKIKVNKTENAFSPLPVRTKAYNADMTACLPLHYKTALFRLQVGRHD
jgi:hypothetical protein